MANERSSEYRLKHDKIVTEFYNRTSEVIIGSRVPSLMPRSSEDHYPSGSATKLEPRQAFNIHIKNIPVVREDVYSIISSNVGCSRPIYIDIFLDSSESTILRENDKNYNRNGSKHKSNNILLERWVISHENTGGGDDAVVVRASKHEPKYELSLVYKRLTMYIRSVYSTTRILPSYSFIRSKNKRNHIGYYISSNPSMSPLQFDKGVDKGEFQFGSLSSVFGKLGVSVFYRKNLTKKRESIGLQSEHIIPDYLSSSSSGNKGGEAVVSPLSDLAMLLTEDRNRSNTTNNTTTSTTTISRSNSHTASSPIPLPYSNSRIQRSYSSNRYQPNYSSTGYIGGGIPVIPSSAPADVGFMTRRPSPSMNEAEATAFSFSPTLKNNSFSAYHTLGIRPHGFAHGAFLNSSPNLSTQTTTITNYNSSGSNRSLLKVQPSTGGNPSPSPSLMSLPGSSLDYLGFTPPFAASSYQAGRISPAVGLLGAPLLSSTPPSYVMNGELWSSNSTALHNEDYSSTALALMRRAPSKTSLLSHLSNDRIVDEEEHSDLDLVFDMGLPFAMDMKSVISATHTTNGPSPINTTGGGSGGSSIPLGYPGFATISHFSVIDDDNTVIGELVAQCSSAKPLNIFFTPHESYAPVVDDGGESLTATVMKPRECSVSNIGVQLDQFRALQTQWNQIASASALE